MMDSLLRHVKEFWLIPKCNGKLLKGFKQWSDLDIICLLEKNYSGCHVHTGLEGSNIEGIKWIKVKVVEMERNDMGLKDI